MIFIFDSETTGLPEPRGIPATDPRYPHLVQLAGIALDIDTEREMGSFEVIVTPDGYEIPAGMAHGITQEQALRVGVPLRLAVALYTNFRRRSTVVVGHNVEFDLGIMAAALHRVSANGVDTGSQRVTCTMTISTDLVKLPPTERMVKAGYGHKHKLPNLTELHQFLFGEGFDGAHSALADVRATARCLLELRRRGVAV